MSVLYLRDQVTLFVGDFIVLGAALWLSLLLRHFESPSAYSLLLHIGPFTFLAFLWLAVFVMVGLYDRHVALFEHRLAATVTEAQLINMLIAVSFFFLVPVRIQPMTILVLYFVVSTVLIVAWRLVIFRSRYADHTRERVMVVGEGPDIGELVAEIQGNPSTHLVCAAVVDTATHVGEPLAARVERESKTARATMLIVDPRVADVLTVLRGDPRYEYIDARDLYEAFFSRVPLSLLEREEVLKSHDSRESRLYGIFKRTMDIVIALVLGVVSLTIYPLVALAVWLDDRGTLFVFQKRVGARGVLFELIKFRSMSGDDGGKYDGGKTKLAVTRVGTLLRRSRVDELPQLWSVLQGTQSLVGPRPELPPLVEVYRREIPHYDLRHLVPPGLSGWAQLYDQQHPHHGSDIDATKRKLSYDLYYVKHRSLILDLDIALKTLKILALRLGA